jgi:hypothetical protein
MTGGPLALGGAVLVVVVVLVELEGPWAVDGPVFLPPVVAWG